MFYGSWETTLLLSVVQVVLREYTQSSEPVTQPLDGMAFRLYLQRHNISPLDAALTAGVRYLTVWRMTRGLPVRREDETLVRQGLFRLTGEWYTAPTLVRAEPVTPLQKQHPSSPERKA